MKTFEICFIFYELSMSPSKVPNNPLHMCGVLLDLFKKWERKDCEERGAAFIHIRKGLEVRSNFSPELSGNGEAPPHGTKILSVLQMASGKSTKAVGVRERSQLLANLDKVNTKQEMCQLPSSKWANSKSLNLKYFLQLEREMMRRMMEKLLNREIKRTFMLSGKC